MEGRDAGRPARPAVELEILPGWGAVVSLRGEHDLSTDAELGRTLTQALGHARVMVDLTRCEFLDSTIIKTLLAGHRRQLASGGRFELVIPPEARSVDRLARLIRLEELMPVHRSRQDGIAGIQADE
jgi:anti-sigma B factor antagonist